MSNQREERDPVLFYRLDHDEQRGVPNAGPDAGRDKTPAPSPARTPPDAVAQPEPPFPLTPFEAAALDHPAIAGFMEFDAVVPATTSAEAAAAAPRPEEQGNKAQSDPTPQSLPRPLDERIDELRARRPTPAPHASLAAQLREVFMEEAVEMLDSLHGSLEALERAPSSAAMIEARRTVHTIKGGARMCGLILLTDLAHACEDIIGAPSSTNTSLPAPMVALLFDAEDTIRAALPQPNIGPGSDENLREVIERVRAVAPTPEPAPAPVLTPPADAKPPRAPETAPTPDPKSAALMVDSVPAPPAIAAAEPPSPGPVSNPTPSAPPSGIAAQLLEVFVEEASEMLDGLHASLEVLEHGPSAPSMIEARRTVHTIKGGARMCGRRAITDLAHACEDVIGPPSAMQDTLPATAISLLFEAEQEMRAALPNPNIGAGSDENARAMADRLRAYRASTPSAAPPADADPAIETSVPAAIQAAVDNLGVKADPAPHPLSGKSLLLRRPTITTVASPTNRLAIDLSKVESLVAKVTEIVANRSASHGLVESLGSTVNEMVRAVHRLQSIAIGLQYQIASHGYDTAPEQDPDGLSLETYGPIQQLMLQLQEAVADQQALVQATMDVVASKRALAAIETRLDTELQGALLNMRLLPLSQLRVRLDQVVRSSSTTAGREVRWSMEGQNVALDKHVCDRLFEPLMHLLRNAIDHGIEPADQREASGKPRAGRIVVHAAVEGNQAIVTVSDDGKGMDADKIAETAIARGIISQAHARELSPREKLDLIFRPGFSTATHVTELSGRGMGMEIVREACTRMGGSVMVAPRPSGGTTIMLQVPLSMSVVHSLVVRDAGRLLAIPAAQVVSVHLVPPTAITKRKRKGHVVRIGPVQMPLFNLPGGQAKSSSAAKEFEERVVLVVPYRGDRVALVVDEIVEEEDQIVKPLPHLLQGVDRLLGAIVLGNGTPTPVLNLPPTLDLISQMGDEPEAPVANGAGEQIILVVDDSLTMRVALTQSLEHAGYIVETARDGQEALEHIRNNGLPNLITLDIEMPRMDGLEALYAIRHTPGSENLPIFMLSSRTGQKHMRTATKLGATRYFTKPYHDSEFIGAVQEATGAVLLTV